MDKYDLTKREVEILKLFYFPENEIAKRLNIERSTVRTHLANLRLKFFCTRRHEVIIQALKDKVISIEDIIME